MRKLARIAAHIQGQPMFKVLARVNDLERQGNSIVHFEIGDPDFETPGNIVEAGCRSLRNGETHYVGSMGLHEMRVAVCEATLQSRGFRPDVEQVLITPGANIILYYAISCLVDPGDDVVLPDPCFPTYRSVVAYTGVNPVYVPLKGGMHLTPVPTTCCGRGYGRISTYT